MRDIKSFFGIDIPFSKMLWYLNLYSWLRICLSLMFSRLPYALPWSLFGILPWVFSPALFFHLLRLDLSHLLFLCCVSPFLESFPCPLPLLSRFCMDFLIDFCLVYFTLLIPYLEFPVFSHTSFPATYFAFAFLSSFLEFWLYLSCPVNN